VAQREGDFKGGCEGDEDDDDDDDDDDDEGAGGGETEESPLYSRCFQSTAMAFALLYPGDRILLAGE